MNKKIIASLVIFAMLASVCATACALRPDADNTNMDTTESRTESLGQSAASDETEPVSLPPKTEFVTVTEITTEAETNPVEDTIMGTYYCSTDFFTDEYRAKYPGQTPYITFNNDGSCVFLVGYLHGICEIEGTYQIEGNEINVELDLLGTPFEGTDSTGDPYMDHQFVFEIINNNHIVIGPAPNSVYNGDCYVVRSGDSFIRK